MRLLLLSCLLLLGTPAWAQAPKSIPAAPARQEGEGPFPRLILRGVTVIDGTGAPPIGPVDVVVQGNRIAEIRSAGTPGLPPDEAKRPKAAPGDKVLELAGHYLLPGFIDLHAHIGGLDQGTPAEYVYKLWLGHGVTTIREPGSSNGLGWTMDETRRSERHEITAPRIFPLVWFGQGEKDSLRTPDQVRSWVGKVAEQGAHGVKFLGARPELMKAALDELKKRGLRSAAHHSQMAVARWNALDSARAGLTSLEHWYGLPEALFDGQTLQDYPLDYNYGDESHRFGQAGRLWKQAARPGSPKWNAVLEELLKLDFTLVPTFTIYEANRDLMRARTAEWHEAYTLPSLWDYYQPSRSAHGSYWFQWTTEDEVAWRENYRLWMAFVNEYKNRGGRVGAGSDSGFIFNLYGFGFIRELELLREAGFHPLEVIRAATLKGAEGLGRERDMGSVEVGKLADLVVVEENVLQNLGSLYGTGAIQLDARQQVRRVGGVKYTIKDGVVFDARKLLADVRGMVSSEKTKRGITRLVQPALP